MLHHLILELLDYKTDKASDRGNHFVWLPSVFCTGFSSCFEVRALFLYNPMRWREVVFCSLETDRCSSMLCLQGLHSRAFTTSP